MFEYDYCFCSRQDCPRKDCKRHSSRMPKNVPVSMARLWEEDVCFDCEYHVRAESPRSSWLPADDWPPERDGRYLLATDRGEILVGEWRDGMLICECSPTTAVKWWMPAPELPES